jgi:beta-glucanase (GH16 family)
VEAGKPSLFLTFDDEFNSLSLNTGTPATAGNVWKTTFYGGDRTLPRNQELEVYVDPDYKGTSTTALGLNPFSDQNGILSISARPATAAALPYLGGYAYTSGLLTTQSSFSQTYGYFEVRAQVPKGQGLWPGFWLLSADGIWPPEIDVLEQIGSGNTYNSNGIFSTVAGATVVHGTFLGTDLSQGFHTYGMAWTPQTITFYVDGQQTFQTATPADMNKPMYMLLNLAVGGTWPGSPDGTTNWSTADYKIDYVRAYSYDPTSIAAPVVTLSNAVNPADLTSSFIAPATGPSTAAIYSAQQMNIAGVVSPTTVSVSYDANNALTVTNKGAWNAVKNATVKESANGAVTVNNFVDAEITMGNGDSTVTVTGAKRGAITVGNGNDRISVTAQSNDTTQNLMKITAGDGNNHISFTGAMAAVAVTAGNGNNQVTIGGQANGTVKTGAGSDDLVDQSTGALSLTGGGGSDLFEFFAGAHATVTDFQAGQDSIVLHGVSPGQVQVSNSAGSTLIALGGGAQIQLAGVALSAGSLNIVYA